MKLRYVRPGDDLADDEAVVVRGGRLRPDIVRQDATRHHAVYGTYAVSVFAVRGMRLEELAQQPPLVRFPELTTTTAGAIRAAGLALLPTGRNPRHFSVELDELEWGVEALRNVEHQVVDNPYHQG